MSWEKSWKQHRSSWTVWWCWSALWAEERSLSKTALCSLRSDCTVFWALKKLETINLSKLQLSANNDLELNHRSFSQTYLWNGKDKIQENFPFHEAFGSSLPKGQFMVIGTWGWGLGQGETSYSKNTNRSTLNQTNDIEILYQFNFTFFKANYKLFKELIYV